ncbi:hypothetical protein A176_003466 [Myxococcus hansupus]|uniref:Uncharacterized protein n=1 Tax=Pseudomyxococcus hansupus TaxID=1297742 RepID=A0A0H4WUT4_9BACT|nr:hypothetical protein A176_003466 [Myxococcus hansupus]
MDPGGHGSAAVRSKKWGASSQYRRRGGRVAYATRNFPLMSDNGPALCREYRDCSVQRRPAPPVHSVQRPMATALEPQHVGLRRLPPQRAVPVPKDVQPPRARGAQLV